MTVELRNAQVFLKFFRYNTYKKHGEMALLWLNQEPFGSAAACCRFSDLEILSKERPTAYWDSLCPTPYSASTSGNITTPSR